MKKLLLSLSVICLFLLSFQNAYAQCTAYDPSSIWVDLEDSSPCGATCGTPTVTGFEVWSNEAYILGQLTAGSEYDYMLSTPSGPGWNPTMTLAAWDGTNVGAVVAFVDGRSLSATIPTDGNYIIIVSETGNCNGAATNGIDNGTLSIDCGTGGATCPCVDPLLTYTAEYNCVTGDIDMDVTSVDAGEVPYTVTVDGVSQTVSATGVVSFTGVNTDNSVLVSVAANNGCTVESSIAATGCATCADGADKIEDGSFEAASWTEVSLVDGNPSGFGVIDGTATLVGAASAWLGGFADTSITSVEQTINIGADSTITLSFWLLGGVCDSPDDYLGVYVDGNSEASFDVSGTFCGSGLWNRFELDLSAYADGVDHTLKFEAYTFATNGNASNYFIDEVMLDACPTNCTSTTSTISESACDSYTSPSGNYTWTSSNTYIDTVQNEAGCDSIITIELTINTLNLATTQLNETLTSDETGATYQWVTCPAMTIIDGATGQSYQATMNGSYAVIISKNSCIDTTECLAVTTLGIVENDFGNNIVVFPNPTNGEFSIDLGSNYESSSIEIMQIDGRIIQSFNFNQSQLLKVQFDEPAGIYLLVVKSNAKKAIIRLIKE
jgi:hypothetical protein